MMTYSVDRYEPPDDPTEDGWEEVASGVALWALRPILRDLQSQGYSLLWSIYVRREAGR